MDDDPRGMTLLGNVAVDVHVYAGAAIGEEDAPADVVIDGGGSVVNHARAHRALGADVELISVYADDAEGRLVLDRLRRERLPTSGLLPLLERNHRTVLFIGPGGGKRIWSDRGTLPAAADVRSAIGPRLAGTRHLHVSPNEWTSPLVESLSSDAVAMSADLHVPERVPDAELLSKLRVLFFSAVGQDDVAARMRELLASGPELVLCTAGAAGCLVAHRHASGISHHPAIPASGDVVDTIGAGDVFAATFLSYWYRGRTIDDAILRAQVQASHSVTARGLRHLLDADELEQRAVHWS